jgi:uncharacterized protein (TIGR03437 family)
MRTGLFGFLPITVLSQAHAKSFGELPLAFEDRHGSYVARGSEYSVLLTPAAAAIGLGKSTVTVRMTGARQGPDMTGIDRLAAKATYFRGTSRESFTLFSRVRAHDVYPGIDVVFHGDGQQLEYDFDVAGSRYPSVIAMSFEGARSIRIGGAGDLMVSAPGGEFRQPRPLAWQTVHGIREYVDVAYRIDAARHVRFVVGPHHPNTPLTIDPQVVFTNALGGKQSTTMAAIALDPQGNIVAAGQTSSPDLPTVNPLQSKLTSSSNTAFVAKWSSDGSQLYYATYLGGSVSDAATGLALDSAGNAYVAGVTNSPDFPVTSQAFQKKLAGASNAFVAKRSADGSQLIYATFLGGGSERTGAIGVDSGGDAIVTGETDSNNFPLTPNAFQGAPVAGCTVNLLVAPGFPQNGEAFVTRLAPDGSSLVYSTLLGGHCGSVGQAVAVDASGGAWVAGATAASDFPVIASALQQKFGGGYVDGFLARFDATGALTYASYLGGSAYDSITGMALDGAGNIFLAGVSGGLSQPASPGAVQPGYALQCFELGIGPVEIIDNGVAFLVKIDPKAGSVLDLTYLGAGCASDAAVAVDSSGAAWVAGWLATPQTFFPTAGPFQIGVGQGFVSKLSPDLTELLFSTNFNQVSGLALNTNGLAYVAGYLSNSVGQSGYVSKVDPTPSAVSLDEVLPSGSAPIYLSGLTVAPGQVLRLIGKGLGPVNATPGSVSSNGYLAASAAGVRVSIGGLAAPLLLVSSGEIDCVVPFEIAGMSSASIQVTYNGAQSNPVLIPVTGAVVEVLGVFNQDFTVNSAANPASPGAIVSVYVAGAGQTTPAGADGQVSQAPYAVAASQIQVQYVIPPAVGPGAQTSTLQSLPVTYAGAAPGAVAGILQINFVAPPQSSTVEIQVGGSE